MCDKCMRHWDGSIVELCRDCSVAYKESKMKKNEMWQVRNEWTEQDEERLITLRRRYWQLKLMPSRNSHHAERLEDMTLRLNCDIRAQVLKKREIQGW